MDQGLAFQAPYQFNVLDEQSALKADFWLLRDHPFEQSAFGRRVKIELFGISACMATAEDTLLHKLYWNQMTLSERQLLDAAGVYAVQVGALDIRYLRHWASLLFVKQKLDELLTGKIKPKTT